MSKHYRKFYLE